MKTGTSLLVLLPLLLIACGPGGSDQIPVTQLPDPVIYGLNITDLPDVGLGWQQTYNQTNIEDGYKWSYLAYQAYQPGNPGAELEAGFAVNNDVAFYEVDVSREDLPSPPDALGDIQDIAWKSAAQPHLLGDRSAVWKTTLGEMLTPVWWLEFYQDHAYVRISLLGFPDSIAPAILYGMGDIVAARLPANIEDMLSDAATIHPSPVASTPTAVPQGAPTTAAISTSPIATQASLQNQLPPRSYAAPPGETGMVTFFDDSGNQLSDGVIGADDILADNGLGTAYEWVGWTDATEPVTITFSFVGEPVLSSVEIGFNHRDGLGISLPRRITINGMSFDLSADEVPNNQRNDLVFRGPFTGPNIVIVLYHQGRGWMLLDEVRFLSEK